MTEIWCRIATFAFCGLALAGCHTLTTTDSTRSTGGRSAAAPSPAPVADSLGAAGGGSAPATGNGDAVPGSNGTDSVSANNLPPCLPADSKTKSVPKRKPHTAQRPSPPTPAEPSVVALPPSPSEASVKFIDASSASILGKQVLGITGDDLGRVVDVLADASGHVRIAIIEIGGFLGLGNRRIAVDWSLLKFHPEDPQGSVTLNVSKRRLQGAPEYKDTPHPLALMAPVAPEAAPAPASAPLGAPAAAPAAAPEIKK